MKYYVTILPVAEKFTYKIEDEMSMKSSATIIAPSNPFLSSISEAKNDALKILKNKNVSESDVIFL